MNLTEITYLRKLSILYEISENKAAVFFIGENKAETITQKLEDPC